MAVDPVNALVALLRADPNVSPRISTRAFGKELPAAENASMPRQAIVLRPSGGGLLGRGYQNYGDKRVDIDCYGATPNEAYALHLVVFSVLKQLAHRVVSDSSSSAVLLHWARCSSDGISRRDPKTDWPMTMSSWQVLASEVSA